MKVGTKSILFGAHCFFIHPFFAAAGWWKMYGFPWDPRLWFAFFVHDIGYWGMPNMDGQEGSLHPHLGANIMTSLFDYKDEWGHENALKDPWTKYVGATFDYFWGHCPQGVSWFWFTFYHSREMAKKYQTEVTRLCIADKMVMVLQPGWMYIPMVWMTGELKEYMSKSYPLVTQGEEPNPWKWYRMVQARVRQWCQENKEVKLPGALIGGVKYQA